jgi:hypothetical protein
MVPIGALIKLRRAGYVLPEVLPVAEIAAAAGEPI